MLLLRWCSISWPALAMAVLACGVVTAAATPAGPRDYRDPHFDYFVTGDPAAPRAPHTEFALLLMGGGGIVDEAYRAIARHAGGGHIVILRAVSDDSFDPDDGQLGVSFAGKWGPVVSAETIVFHDRSAASDPRVIAAIRGADGIFLAGGDQANYIRYWKGTPVQAALNAHVAANRPIGGSSAGLAILGHYSYTALDGGSLESKVALADPQGSGVTLESDFLHLRCLENVITDTHFSTRARLGRLIVFVARINQEQAHDAAFGIGLDERSVLAIGPDGIGRLVPGSAGGAWLVYVPGRSANLPPGGPATVRDIQIVRLDRASSIDLKTRRVTLPAAKTLDSIEQGVVPANSIAAGIMTRDVVPPDES